MSNLSENSTVFVQPKTTLKGVLMLLLTALIWGTSFVSQSLGSDSVGGFTFMGVRTLLGAIFLTPYILMKDKIQSKKMSAEQIENRKKADKKLLKYGVIIGIFLCLASNFQQFAFYEPNMTSGKIAFITAMYMFLVPLVGLAIFKKKVPVLTWICIAIGFLGLYFLCFEKPELKVVGRGDIFAFICAIFFTLQILFIERWAPGADGIKLSCIQFYTCGIISFILMLIFENPTFESIKSAAGPILYSGIMSCGFAYTMQVVGQKYCESTVASLLMSMESVFAALSGAVFIGEALTGREAVGCGIMFFAIILSQLSELKLPKKSKN